MSLDRGDVTVRGHVWKSLTPSSIFYTLASGCGWRMLPHDLPPWPTVYYYFRCWRLIRLWQQMKRLSIKVFDKKHTILLEYCRKKPSSE